MCDVPSIAVFCSESIECFPGIIIIIIIIIINVLVFYQLFLTSILNIFTHRTPIMMPKVNDIVSISKGLLSAHNRTKMKKLEAV